MKKYFLTLLLSSFLISLVSCKDDAKKQTTQDILMSCIWEYKFDDESEEDRQELRAEEYYTRDTSYLYIIDNGERPYEPSKSLYYFSNTYDSIFDESKVGKLTDGKYILRMGSNNQIMGDRILKVSDKRIDFVRKGHPRDTTNLKGKWIYKSEKLPYFLRFKDLESTFVLKSLRL